MAIAQFKQQDELDLQSELDRKVLDTIEKLDLQYNTGQITEQQLGTGLATLYNAVFGLVSDAKLGDIMDAYEPTVTAKTAYFSKLRKLDAMVFVIWVRESSAIEVHGVNTGDVKRYDIPVRYSPHDYYNKVLDAMEAKGWSAVEDNNEE